ncbi:MAG: hypothetical protein K6C32_02095, partial [Bacilli bacterium]|nr:hypothetical protein [Bacilli bacterium]
MRVKKKGGFVRVLLNILYWAFFSCLVFVMVNQIIDEKTQYKSPLFGHRVTVIVTPSMETV